MNWGYKLLFAYLVFLGGMGYLVYRSMNTNYELVEKDYYKQELSYQQVIDGTNRANRLGEELSIQQQPGTLEIMIPTSINATMLTGSAWFYCAYDAKMDQRIELKPGKDGKLIIDKRRFAPGQYTVKISWSAGEQDYYTEQPLFIQ